MQATLPTTHTARNWAYLMGMLPGLITITGNLLGGPWALGNVLFTFGLMTVIDKVMPQFRSNDYDHDETLPNLVLGLLVLLQTLSLFSLFWGIHSGALQGWWLFAAVLSTGTFSGPAANNVGHELCHRKERAWYNASRWLFFTAGNPYFTVAHVRVHHLWVGTDRDTTTARYGEHLYAFIIRSVAGQLRDAFRLEAERLRKAAKPAYGLENYPVNMLTSMLLLTGLLYLWLGWLGVAAYWGNVLVATFLLEYVNYIQHYGLTRQKIEKVNETHAWQSNHLTRFILVDLTRHPDHHTHGAKHYHKLLAYDRSPEMPLGYSGMLLLAMLPPLWFSVMNKRLADYQASLQQSPI